MAEAKDKWTNPGAYAIARNIAGSDWAAGLLLYRLMFLWKARKRKLTRFGKEWLAMSRADWARSAGLTESELKNRALRKLEEHCGGLVDIRTMRVSPKHPNTIWMSLDTEALEEAITPWDMYEPKLNGMKGIGNEKGVGQASDCYPYKKAV